MTALTTLIILIFIIQPAVTGSSCAREHGYANDLKKNITWNSHLINLPSDIELLPDQKWAPADVKKTGAKKHCNQPTKDQSYSSTLNGGLCHNNKLDLDFGSI